MKFYPALVFIVAALAAPAVLCAAVFEGKVRMKMTDQRGNTQEINQRMREGFVRTDIEAEKGPTASVIMDFEKQEMIILMPAQKMYLTRPLSDATTAVRTASGGDDVTLEKTNDREKILGYECVKYLSKSKNLTTDLWITDELGRFMGLGSGGGGPMGGSGSRRGGPPPLAWETALMGKDFFPLRVVSHDAKGAEQFRMEAVAIEKEPQPASVFTPPAGYQKLDLGGVMQGLGFPGKR